MAAQSIVDFVKDSLVSGQTADRLYGAAAYNSPLHSAAMGAGLARANPAPVAPAMALTPANELAYITNASQVIKALQGDARMTARQAFDAAGAADFPAFQATMADMVLRGLIQVAGRDERYGDEIYRLASSSC